MTKEPGYMIDIGQPHPLKEDGGFVVAKRRILQKSGHRVDIMDIRWEKRASHPNPKFPHKHVPTRNGVRVSFSSQSKKWSSNVRELARVLIEEADKYDIEMSEDE